MLMKRPDVLTFRSLSSMSYWSDLYFILSTIALSYSFYDITARDNSKYFLLSSLDTTGSLPMSFVARRCSTVFKIRRDMQRSNWKWRSHRWSCQVLLAFTLSLMSFGSRHPTACLPDPAPGTLHDGWIASEL